MSQPPKPPVRLADLVVGATSDRRQRRSATAMRGADRPLAGEPNELDTLSGELEAGTLHDLPPIDHVALALAAEALRPCPPQRPSGLETLTSYLEDTSAELAEARAALEDLEAYARLPWWRRLFTVPRSLRRARQDSGAH